MPAKDFEKLLYPEDIAIFGVSRSKEKPGRVVFDNIVHSNYEGKVYPINPKADEIEGFKVYQADEVSADVAIVAVRAEIAVDIAEKYGKNFKFLVVLSGGFSEVGRSDLKERLLEASRKHGFRILGPNCLGYINTEIDLNATFLPKEKLKTPKKGKISIISQSGANVAVAVDIVNQRGIGINKAISYGNQIDIKEYELLRYLDKDDSTSVIGAYMEGISNGEAFYETVKNLTKPFVVLKAGRTQQAKKAAKSHTASLAGSYEVFKGIASQLKIPVVDDFNELFLSLQLFERYGMPKGRRVLVVTCGGGYGVMTVDTLAEQKVPLADIPKDAIEALKKEFPPRVVVGNPTDVTGDGNVEMFKKAFEHFDPYYDIGIAILLPQLPAIGEDYSLLEQINKPIVAIIPGRKVETSLPYADSILTAVKAIKAYTGVCND